MLVALLVAATVTPVVVAAVTGAPAVEHTARASSVIGSASGDTPPAGNNTTRTPVPRHENPENRSRRGSLGMYERWLAGRMGEVLVDCTEGARARQFGACDLDSEYPDWLGKYVDVARETETESDDEAADAFAEAKEEQRTFTDDVERFWRTHEEYQEARDRGDTAQARRLARRLRRLAGDVNDTAGALRTEYRRISTTTQVDLNASARTGDQVAQNITRTANDVESDLFIATTVSVRANTTATSFLQPLGVTGHLTTANGTALADRSIRVTIAGRTIQTETDADGRFTLSYRPTTLPLATERVPVRYIPRNASVYLPARATLPVTVEQVDPTVTVSRRPETVGFGDTVVVTGPVGAGDIRAPSVPVRVSRPGGPTTTVATGADGTYRAQFTVPLTVPEGDHQIRATVPLDGRALGRATATTTVTVQRTDTTLTLTGAPTGGDAIRVAGRLTTVDGQPVGGQSIRIALNGTTVETFRTGVGGRYTRTVPVPPRLLADVDANATVTVGAQFAATDTNLAPARNATLVRVSRAGAGGADGPSAASSLGQAIVTELATWSVWQWLVASVGVAALLAGLAFAWRKRGRLRQYIAPLVVVGGRLAQALGTAARVLGRVAWWAGSRSLGAVGRVHGAVWDRDEATGADAAESDAVVSGPTASAGDGAADATGTTSAAPSTPLERAHQQLATGTTDTAVQTAYAVARAHLSTGGEPEQGATHWEFYTAAHDRLVAEQRDALQRLTEAYEAAAFAPTAVEAEGARAALATAEQFVNDTVVQSDGGQVADASATNTTDEPAE